MEENKNVVVTKTNGWDVLKGYAKEHPILTFLLADASLAAITALIKAPAAIIHAVKGTDQVSPATVVDNAKDVVNTVKEVAEEVKKSKPVKK